MGERVLNASAGVNPSPSPLASGSNIVPLEIATGAVPVSIRLKFKLRHPYVVLHWQGYLGCGSGPPMSGFPKPHDMDGVLSCNVFLTAQGSHSGGASSGWRLKQRAWL
ncbi:hypothetical protein RJZ56_006270 [Blastomyces dermatitidis]